jgi:hypothetical protein
MRSGNSNSYLTLRFLEGDYARFRAIGTDIQYALEVASSNLEVLDVPKHVDNMKWKDITKGMVLRIQEAEQDGLFAVREVAPDGGCYKLGRLGGGSQLRHDVLSAQVLADLTLEKEFDVSAKRLKGLRPVVIAVPRVASVLPGNASESSHEAIGFDPQNDNLHVTLSFFADGLQQPTTSPETITQLHAMIKDQVANHMFELVGEAQSIPLYVGAFEQFPPGKHNLIVARLEFRDAQHDVFIRKLWLKSHYLLMAAGVKVREAPRLPSSLSKNSLSFSGKSKDAGTQAGSSSAILPDASVFLDIVDGLSSQELKDLTSDWQPHLTLGKIAATTAQLGQSVVSDVVRRLNERYAGFLADSGTGSVAACKFPLSVIGIGMGGQTPVKARFLNWNELTIGDVAGKD